jgi:hypothetical protein
LNADPDGTGQTNLFKYIAGLNPIDPTCRFVVTAAPVSGQSGEVAITYSPVVAGRTYVVQYSTNLGSGNWQTLTDTTQSTSGNATTIVDPNAANAKFYKVQITY